MYDICLTVLLHGASSVYWVFCLYSAVRSSVPTSASGTNGTRQALHSFKRGILPLQKSTFPYICIANKGKCFCLAHYGVTIAKDTVNSQ